jgi:hypothetical protein
MLVLFQYENSIPNISCKVTQDTQFLGWGKKPVFCLCCQNWPAVPWGHAYQPWTLSGNALSCVSLPCHPQTAQHSGWVKTVTQTWCDSQLGSILGLVTQGRFAVLVSDPCPQSALGNRANKGIHGKSFTQWVPHEEILPTSYKAIAPRNRACLQEGFRFVLTTVFWSKNFL